MKIPVLGILLTIFSANATAVIQLDKQVSCDAGANWYDVGLNDGVAEGCTGLFVPSDPAVGHQIMMRFFAQTDTAVEDCVLEESNPAVLGGPVLIGDLEASYGGLVFQTPLLECNDFLLSREPDTARLTCTGTDPAGETLTDVDRANVEACLESAVEVTKVSTGQDSPGNFIYSVTVANPPNPNGATLQNCVVDDPEADCVENFFPGPLFPGQEQTIGCLSPNLSNTATVTCEVQGHFFPDGSPVTTTDQDRAGAVQLDKQVSCDAGATWHDVGFGDGVIDGCTGLFDPTDPAVGRQMVMRYLVHTGTEVSNCVLEESNPAILPMPMPIGNLNLFFDGEVFQTDLFECNDFLLMGEPDTARLICTGPAGETLTDVDRAYVEACLEPAVEVTKVSTGQDSPGNFIYSVTVANPPNPNGATLQNCVVDDPEADCVENFFPGPLIPGQEQTIGCRSPNLRNTATVTCEVQGHFYPDGSPVTKTDQDTAGAVQLDKQVSCDAGATWHDEGYGDAVIDGCTGLFDPTDPAVSRQMMMRYVARTGTEVSNCVLEESNPAVLPMPMPIGNLNLFFDGEVFRTDLFECNDFLLMGEPDTARLICTGPAGETLTDVDSANVEACLEPAVELTKTCVGQNSPGLLKYSVKVANPSSDLGLQNCIVSDPEADCDGAVILDLPPGQEQTIECLISNVSNAATVTCDVAGYSLVTASDQDSADCACDAGFFGPSCDACPGGAFNVCSGNGTCSDGATGTGICTCSTGFIGEDCSLASLDHFLSYDVKTTKKTPKFEKREVILKDQFLEGLFRVDKLEELLNPANKNDEGISDFDTHLVSYKVKELGDLGHFRLDGILVENQFGALIVNVEGPERLLVPASKDLFEPPLPPDPDVHNVDHFLCYKIKGVDKDSHDPKDKDAHVIQVLLQDQFENEHRLFDIKKPKRLCNPVDKNGEGIKNPDDHLLCYEAKPAKGEWKHSGIKGVFVSDQFGLIQVDTKKEKELCLPSMKTLPPLGGIP